MSSPHHHPRPDDDMSTAHDTTTISSPNLNDEGLLPVASQEHKLFNLDQVELLDPVRTDSTSPSSSAAPSSTVSLNPLSSRDVPMMDLVSSGNDPVSEEDIGELQNSSLEVPVFSNNHFNGGFGTDHSGAYLHTSNSMEGFEIGEDALTSDLGDCTRERTPTVFADDALTSSVEITRRRQQSKVDSVQAASSSPPQNETINKQRVTKVKFRENIVLGYAPARQFERNPDITSDDVLRSYRAACEKHRIKPISDLISQIDKAGDLIRERLPLLTLKGEKLDSRSCEALEEVFNKVQCDLLDVENTNLDDQSASALFDMIEFYESAFKLRLGSNPRMTAHAWMATYQMLRKSPFLELLDCSNSEFVDNSMMFVARALRNGCSLTTLHLEHCRLSGRHTLLLMTGLKTNLIMKELFLAENNLNPQDGMQVGAMLKCNTRLQLLDLRINNLQDTGVAYICEGLREQTSGSGLAALVLWNNRLTAYCSQYLTNALSVNKSLETLNIGCNEIKDEGILMLKDGLIRNKSLLRIGLLQTKIGSEGAVALAEFIADSRRIVRLDLRENNLQVAGLMALAHALKLNYTIIRMDVENTAKKEPLKDYANIYSMFLEQIQFLCKRNKSLSEEEEARRLVLQQQAANFRRKSSLPTESSEVKEVTGVESAQQQSFDYSLTVPSAPIIIHPPASPSIPFQSSPPPTPPPIPPDNDEPIVAIGDDSSLSLAHKLKSNSTASLSQTNASSSIESGNPASSQNITESDTGTQLDFTSNSTPFQTLPNSLSSTTTSASASSGEFDSSTDSVELNFPETCSRPNTLCNEAVLVESSVFDELNPESLASNTSTESTHEGNVV